MKTTSLLLSLLLTASCLTPSLTTQDGSRRPASTEELSGDKILKMANFLLKIREETKLKKFKAIAFPIRNAEAVSPRTIETDMAELDGRAETNEADKALEPLREWAMDTWGVYADKRKYVQDTLTGGLSLNQRDQLLDLCFGSPAGVGDTFTLAEFKAKEQLCKASGLLHTDAELAEALVNFPAVPSGVRYDGRRGFHVYDNPALEKQARLITAAVNTHLHRFYEIFLSQEDAVKEKFRINKDGSAEADKVEPFDLISTLAVREMMAKNMGYDPLSGVELNKIQISKLTQKALARMLHTKNIYSPQWRALPNIIVSKADNALSVMCANGLPDSRVQQDPQGFEWLKVEVGTELLETWQSWTKLSDQFERGTSRTELSCNGVNYKFVLEKVNAEAIPAPAPIKFKKGQELYALMTVSLVSEIDRGAVEQARKLVSLLAGWQPVSEVIQVKTREFLRTELIKADAYFPVMHAMDTNYFNIGTEKGLALRLRKVVKDETGADRVINLALLLPDGAQGFDSVILKPNDLAKLLHERFLKKPTSLFLMNNSCSSERTLFAWTLVFREALELRKADGKFGGLTTVNDFPYIIGSKRNFGTASLVEIFSHAEFPLRSLEMLGQGKSVPQIVDYLKAPVSQGFIGQLGNLFGGSKNVVNKEEGSSSFEPVFVLDHPELLSLGGFHITVTGDHIQGRDRY